MYIRLDGLEIENKHLTTVAWYTAYLVFAGVALEEHGKRICDQLSKFKEDQIVEVEAELKDYNHYEGICKIVKIEFPSPTLDKAPAIYRFRVDLKPVR